MIESFAPGGLKLLYRRQKEPLKFMIHKQLISNQAMSPHSVYRCPPTIMTQEGVDALDRYILYKKQQGDLSFDRILTLEKRLRALRTKLNEEKCKQKKQSSLDSWLI